MGDGAPTIGGLRRLSLYLAGQEKFDVDITGGTITGVAISDLDAPLPVADGGTGADNSSDARTNLGLGSLSLQSSTAISVTGGTVNGVIIGGSTPAAGTFTTATANSFIPDSATVPTNGVYLPAANQVGIAVNGGPAARFFDATSGVPANYFAFGGSPSSAGLIQMYAQGADANITMGFAAKADAGFSFYSDSGSRKQFGINRTATSVNNLYATGGVAGAPASVTLGAEGSSTNVDIAITPKGTGVLKFGTHTGSTDVAISGYITIKDAAGNERKLAVIT